MTDMAISIIKMLKTCTGLSFSSAAHPAAAVPPDLGRGA